VDLAAVYRASSIRATAWAAHENKPGVPRISVADVHSHTDPRARNTTEQSGELLAPFITPPPSFDKIIFGKKAAAWDNQHVKINVAINIS
jgi:hypothetical protein